MKRLAITLLIAISLIFGIGLTSRVLAFNINNPSGSTGGVCSGGATNAYCSETTGKDKITGPNGVLVTVTDIISLVAGIAAVIMILVASIRFITSGGDENAVSSAKSMLMYAIIGIVVLALAQVIVRFVISKAP